MQHIPLEAPEDPYAAFDSDKHQVWVFVWVCVWVLVWWFE